jgi:hypothetical protein
MNNPGYSIKPLDGSPLISDNCWNVVLESVKKRLKNEDEVRCLEWGGGNSTVSLLRTGLESGKKFELNSIDHDTRFFPYLAESLIFEFLKNGTFDTQVSWKSLRGPSLSIPEAKKILSRHRQLKSSTIDWQLLTGNKRIQFAEGVVPFFGFFHKKFLRQLSKLLLIKLEYFLWVADGVIAQFIKRRQSGNYSIEESTFHLHGEGIKSGLFSDYFEKRKPRGYLEVTQGKINLRLWHIPELNSFFWKKGVLLDGTVEQLPDFIDAPLEGKFDLVFVDGRARVSCIKRTFYDRLLKDGGYLFVHDAYRAEMAEGFKLFTPTPTFIQGSNITLNGSIRCAESFGYPLIRIGESVKKLDYKIAQELFMYQN